MADPNQIKIVEARLSFPDIWRPKAIKSGKGDPGEPKYSCHFLLDKKEQADQIKALKLAIFALAKEKFGEKAGEMIKKGKVTVCLHEGSDKDYDGYSEENMYLSTSSSKRPTIVDRDKTALAEDDRRPYGGCYVNGIVRLWCQDNNFGKRVNAELMGIQFVKDGEPFGAAPLDEDAFEDLDAGKKKGAKAEGDGGDAEPDADEEPF
jgi:hypothetical protein